MLVDLTEQQARDEAARRYVAIVESSNDAIVAKDLNGIITAWNPGSRLQPRASNRSAQRALLQCLRSLARGGIAAGIGVGANGWREPSLFAVGLGAASLDAIAHRFGQLGYVHGQGSGVAQLRLTDAAGAP